ncbi:Bacterial regulatory protein, tetR family [compost metagenome]
MARPRVRQRLLQAAAELLAEQGPGALTTRAVAGRAGVTEASLFNNFGDKAGLLRALLVETGEEFPAFLDALAAPAEPLDEWVVGVFRHARAWFRRVLPLSAPNLLGQPAPGSEASYTAHRALAGRLAELRCVADAEATALLLMGAAMHTALSELAQGDRAIGVDERELALRLGVSLGLLVEG